MSNPARIRVGAAVLLPGPRLLRGPAREVRVWPQTARLLARLAAAGGATVPRGALADVLYAPGVQPRAEDGGAEVVYTVACHARRALREVGAGVGIATVVGRGLRLDPEARDGALVVGHRRDRSRLLDADAAGATGRELAERFGYKSRHVAYVTVCKVKRRMRETAERQAAALSNAVLMNLTPTPPPFSGMNSTPACSKAERMAASVRG